MSDACGRCAGHGTVRGYRFDMESSPVESYHEPCPQCMGSGRCGVVHCFFGCGFSVRDINPFEAHKHMEQHFEVQHRDQLDALVPRGSNNECAIQKGRG